MSLEKLTNRIYFLPHQPEVDRPMLAYICGSNFSIAIDAGYSASHVEEFYHQLNNHGFDAPDFTVITHWHYDHTYGMAHTKGATISHCLTNEYLVQEMGKPSSYIDELKNEDACFAKEYSNQINPVITTSNIEFKDEMTLHLGSITAQIFHTESPHSNDSVCVYIPEEKVLFLGDATSEDFFNDGYMDKDKLQSLTDMIKSTDCIYCILSHCEPLHKDELLTYLHDVLNS